MSNRDSHNILYPKAPTASRKASELTLNNYDNLNLTQKLSNTNYEQLCKQKKEAEKNQAQEEQTAQEKYNELSKQVKDLYVEFINHCIPGDFRNRILKKREGSEETPTEVIKQIKVILKMMQDIIKEQDKISLLYVEDRKSVDYEILLQKAEGDIKRYIRSEQQLRYVVDTLQNRIEDYDKDKDNFLFNAKNLFKDAKTDNAKLIELIKKKDLEIVTLNKIQKQKDETIKSYEERLLSVPILEHKMRSLKERHAKEKELVKQYYKQEFANLTKEVQHIHKILSVNLSLDERLKLLEEELMTYKNFNMKKMQILEEKIKLVDDLNDKIDSEQVSNAIKYDEIPTTDRKSSIVSAIPAARNKSQNIRLVNHKSMTYLSPKNAEDKNFIIKKNINKKKNEIFNEINMLSIVRMHDLNQELGNSNNDYFRSKSPKKFDDYFSYLQRKLDKLNKLNDEEKNYLSSLTANNTYRKGSVKDNKSVQFIEDGQMRAKRLDEQLDSIIQNTPTAKNKYQRPSLTDRAATMKGAS